MSKQHKTLLHRCTSWAAGVWMAGFTAACGINDFTEMPAAGEAPSITITSKDTVNFDGDFKIAAEFKDNTPGLSTAEFTLSDALGKIVFTETVQLLGSRDSLAVTVDSGTVNIGRHLIQITAFDTEGSSNTVTMDLLAKGIFQNQDAMYMRGSFNSWGAAAMTLVSDYTWQLPVTLKASDDFKFADTDDWSGLDWGDNGCNNTAVPGGGNIKCVPSDGAYLVSFNDETLAYELRKLSANNAEMYIKGAFNNWTNDNKMQLIDDNIWETKNVTLAASDEFKFANTGDWSGKDWGDDDCNKVAVSGDGNIKCEYEGTFTVRFNDATLEYSFL